MSYLEHTQQLIQFTLDDLGQKGSRNWRQWQEMGNGGFMGRSKLGSRMRAIVFQEDKQALLTVFSFQLIKLCIIQSQGRKSHPETPKCIDSIFELLDKPQFQIPITMPDSPLQSCSQQTLKSLLSEFLHQSITHHQSQHSHHPHHLITPLTKLNKYPQILQIFRGFLHELLILGDICMNYSEKLNMWTTYEFFSSYFNMETYTDSHDNYIYFPQTRLYVYQASPSTIYMVEQYDQKQINKVRTQKAITEDGHQKQQSQKLQLQQNSNSQQSINNSQQFSQIDVQQFSNILNSNNTQQQEIENGIQGKYQKQQQDVVVMLSDLNIGSEKMQKPEQINTKQQQEHIYKITQSEIIFIPYNNTLKATFESSQNSDSKEKQSITTTYSSFRKNSGTLCKDSIKAYLANPTMLQSQFIQTDNQGKREKREPFVDNKFKEYYQHTSQTFYKPDSFSTNFFQPYQPYQPSHSSPNTITIAPTFNININSGTQSSATNPNPNSNINPNYNKNMNISQQYTNSFILQKVSEPYRSIIKAKKSKAREQRKNLYKIMGKF